MILKLIFFKNVPCEDLFIIFLAFRERRTHWALSGRCSPSEILILCPNEPCLANLASGKKIGKKAFFDIFFSFFELQRDKGNSSGSTKIHLKYLHMILLRDKNDIGKKKVNRKSFQAALLYKPLCEKKVKCDGPTDGPTQSLIESRARDLK